MERGFPIPALIGAGISTLAGGAIGAGTLGGLTYAFTNQALPSLLSGGIGGLLGGTAMAFPAAQDLRRDREARMRQRLGLNHARQMPIGTSNPVYAQPSNTRYRRV